MALSASTTTRQAVRAAALLLAGGAQDFDPLLERVGDARIVLIGEASHGTREFYDLRADITRRLIAEKGFTAVAIEGDWPDAYRVDRYVRGAPGDTSAGEALEGFREFPGWMWRNTEVAGFVDWLRRWNATADAGRQAGFYGLDLYDIDSAIDGVVGYLRTTDPAAAGRARRRYACFGRYLDDPTTYAPAVDAGMTRPCATAATEQLRELERRTAPPGAAAEALFSARQNARVVVNGERYYRGMYGDPNASWNLRDSHMMETLRVLLQRSEPGRAAKIVVWAHNSHVGDARATQLGASGQTSLGRLAREHDPRGTVLVGFSTYQGSVTAARDWGAPAERRTVRPGLPGSYEALFHEVGLPAFQLRLDAPALHGLATPRLQRAIGVVYRPEMERTSHYFEAVVTRQFDWLIHIDTTQALEPLERGRQWTPPVAAARAPQCRLPQPTHGGRSTCWRDGRLTGPRVVSK